jgi:hypothetical protein
MIPFYRARTRATLRQAMRMRPATPVYVALPPQNVERAAYLRLVVSAALLAAEREGERECKP